MDDGTSVTARKFMSSLSEDQGAGDALHTDELKSNFAKIMIIGLEMIIGSGSGGDGVDAIGDTSLQVSISKKDRLDGWGGRTRHGECILMGN